MRPSSVAALLLPLVLLGCHSAYVEATIENGSGKPIPLVEVDYPSASFGTQDLAPGARYTYRFKVLGEGPTKVLWTDSAHADHSATGPELREDDEGKLTISFGGGGAPVWTKSLTSHGQPR